jgi:hypothetical protein
MDIVKKNMLSIICGVVALLCVIALFFPLSGMYERLREDVKKSVATGERLSAVLNQPRNWPSLSPLPEDRVPLKDKQGRNRFPNAAVVTAGSKMTTNWKQQASEFLSYALDQQNRQIFPLVPGALPNGPMPLRAQFQYSYAERFMVPIDSNTGRPREGENKTIFKIILDSSMPPTDAEIAEKSAATARKVELDTVKIVNGAPTNTDEVTRKVAEAVAGVADRMRQDAAITGKIYADPNTSIVPVTTIAGSQAPSANAIFDAQVSLWVEEEICKAIKATNHDAKPTQGVLDSPIKRLLVLTVRHPYAPRSSAGTPVDPAAAPLAAPQSTEVKVPLDYKKNPLGHVSNELYDVITFDLKLICEADSLPNTLGALTRGRYMMFQKVHTIAVDSAPHAAQGFLYGSKQVVQVDITGEYLMLRRVIAPYMPPDIIRGLTPVAAAPQ